MTSSYLIYGVRAAIVAFIALGIGRGVLQMLDSLAMHWPLR